MDNKLILNTLREIETELKKILIPTTEIRNIEYTYGHPIHDDGYAVTFNHITQVNGIEHKQKYGRRITQLQWNNNQDCILYEFKQTINSLK